MAYDCLYCIPDFITFITKQQYSTVEQCSKSCVIVLAGRQGFSQWIMTIPNILDSHG